MLRSIRKENPELVHALLELRRAAKHHDAPIWGTVASKLARPRHAVDPVNVGHLDRLSGPHDTVVVPGKLLADGRITKPLTVAAFHYSKGAREKIQRAGGTALALHELLKAKPTGTGVHIVA